MVGTVIMMRKNKVDFLCLLAIYKLLGPVVVVRKNKVDSLSS